MSLVGVKFHLNSGRQIPRILELSVHLPRFRKKTQGLTARAVSTLLTWLGTDIRAAVVESLADRMNITVNTPHGPIHYYAPTPLLIARAQGMIVKEADTIRWIDSFPDSCVFWDVGANVGVYSLYAAIRRSISVLSFEPQAANFHVLCRNVELNDLAEQVTVYCIALSRITELGLLNMASASMGSALSQFGRRGEMSRYCTSEDTNGCTHGMIGYSVDDFVDQFHPAFPNYVKMDVDGLEWNILQGARNTLSDPRLRSLLVELTLTDQREHDFAVAFLEDFSFRLVSVGDVQGTEAGEAANHLFERRIGA